MVPLFLVTAYAVTTGSCGENVTYEWNGSSLTITGTGPMNNYLGLYYGSGNHAPWWNNGTIKYVTIDEGVTSIGSGTFARCQAMWDISIPESVVSIGDGAFEDCIKLSRITIPEGITKINRGTFLYCTMLHDVNLPESLTVIEENAFYNCTNLVNVMFPKNLETIADHAFAHCEYLDTVSIPSGVRSIAPKAFVFCKNLKSISVDESNSVYSNDDLGVLYDKNQSSLIRVPEGLDTVFSFANSVTEIGECAFYNCDNLESIAIPEGISIIREETFYSCSALTSVTLPASIKRISSDAFQSCDNLTDVYYGGSETEWNELTINSGNDNLKNATIHFNSTGPSTDDGETDNGEGGTGDSAITTQVRFFREWDAENQIAYFDNDLLLGSQVTEETDTSFLVDVDNLVGHYVLAETKARDDSDVAPDTLISIKPVETKTGTVSAANDETITIDGVVYATPANKLLPSALMDNFVLYHLDEGALAGVELLVTKEGTLTYWNTETRELIIINSDQTTMTFTVSELANEETLTFLGETGYTERDVQYVTDNNKFVYKVKMQPISVEPAKFEFGKDDFSFLNISSDYFTTEERVWHETLSQVSILQGFDTNYNYHISDQAFSHLVDGMSNTVAMYLDAARSLKWEGSCFGMAAVAAIRYIDESRLPIEKIDTNLSSNSNTYDLSAPVESLSTEDLINYYMLTQYLPRSGVITEQNTDLVSTDYLGAVTKIINTLNSGTPVMVCISNSEICGGHTIVLLDVKGSTQDYYEISVYDPNYSEETLLYLYTSSGSNTNKIRIAYSSSVNVNTEAITYNQIHQFFTSVSEIDMKNYFGVDNNSLFTDFDRAYFQINQNTDVIISTGNVSLSYQDGEVVSAENISGPYYYCTDADSSSTVYFTFDFVDITSDEILCELQSADDDSCKAQIVLDDWSLSVSSDQNLKLSIDSQTCNATITSVDKGFISFLATQDEVDAEWPWYASAVDFENATNVVVSYTDNGIKLESDGLNNASIAAMNDTELIVNDISCDETVVQLIENDGTIEAVSPHIHLYEAPEFVWSDDNTCTATFTCIDGDDTQTMACTVTSKTTPATEAEAGATVYTATVEFNGQTYTDTRTVEIPATGHVTHVTTLVPAVEATCEHTGNIAYYTCSGCNLWFEDAEATKVIEDHNSVIIPLAVHSYGSVVTAPTCTEQGYTTHTCSVCGDSYVDTYIDATGHSFGEWTEIKAATCTEKGEETRTCACGEVETRETAALGHTADEAAMENEVAASCGADGSYDSVVYCATCGDELSRETVTVPATGDHNYAIEQERMEATCTEDGYVIKACGCGATEKTVLPATGHDYESVVTAPTCIEQGYTTHTCINCGDSYVDSYVDATGHSFGEWTETKAATCTEKGEETRICACGKTETREIKALGHTYQDGICNRCGEYDPDYEFPTEPSEPDEPGRPCWDSFWDWIFGGWWGDEKCDHEYTSVITAPTCDQKGYTTHTCDKCGDSYKDSYTNALGHQFENGVCTKCGKNEKPGGPGCGSIWDWIFGWWN